MDDVTAAKLFELLRSQQILLSELHLDVQALIDCLSLVADFRKSFDARKHELELETQEQTREVLESIGTKIRELKNSNGGA